MELREFITKALLDIINGIEDAQQQSPIDTIIPDIAGGDQKARPEISNIQSIEFEVSIKVDKQTSGEGKLNVGLQWFGGDVKGEHSESAGHDATLKFRIPVRFSKHRKKE